MNVIIAHEHDPKKYLEATFGLSFASAKWQRIVMVRRKRKSWYIRQHYLLFHNEAVQLFIEVWRP